MRFDGSDNGRVIRTLVSLGASLDSRLANGMTPLHAACSVGAAANASALIKLGASLTSTDKFGNTPLLSGMQFPDIVSLLLAYGGWPPQPTSSVVGMTAFQRLVASRAPWNEAMMRHRALQLLGVSVVNAAKNPDMESLESAIDVFFWAVDELGGVLKRDEALACYAPDAERVAKLAERVAASTAHCVGLVRNRILLRERGARTTEEGMKSTRVLRLKYSMCSGCRRFGRMQVCGGCVSTAYCSRACQVGAWPAHRATCVSREEVD
jgi:hypothetical protein